ncbi:RagB/SusD family nutrient uptake outer membrane protein [Sinomicrobium weinanense]|uniref:RagB/SusD family nutrient uptake outer membrane protein n=1 Tax=Sinomicrobium weinanense TaxID=2842200 RepID=A0A926JSK8_9FLAO|nr:RagB/SusD family nutrient uptake outer membrane protein [Sinomicrobium weinanense]MBC9796544.1 RagB/SusD family nutrient uptake outer membrane protein [Sinomicrobium weinanense]MBU3123069.1 RagB/SusD family nutrient uptake outer membrane protein [Sinomicrobium weinanense]
MKRLYILITVCAGLLVSSCNDDFMERYPLDQITDENFWQTEQDLELYCNELYAVYIRGFSYEWGDGTISPYGYNEAAIPYGDVITDNAAPNSYSKVAANEYTSHTTEGSGSGGWSWGDMRKLNYFLDNYQRGDVAPEVRNVYLGEVLFFKAWDYFKKVKTFGDVPWYTHVLETDSEELYAPRSPREEVMDSVMKVLDEAIANLPEKGSQKPGRISKDVALHLKSRIGLFEGTYRKYHTELGLDGARFLEASIEASEKLMNAGYALYTTGDINEDYHNLFSQYSYGNNPEIILWKEYSADENLGVAFSRYYAQNLRHRHGATRALVDTYLCTDGQPIALSPLFEGKDSIQQEMLNRDPRLRQTICNFGEYALAEGVMGADNAPLPNIPGLSGNKCPTGYRVAKWFFNEPDDWGRLTRGMQAAPIFRYAEILLNYAEAKYELGQISQDVIDQTVNQIRARVDMPPLNIGAIPADPMMDSDYATYCDYVPEPVLREIRRERRVELAFENFRWDDLMRWKAGRFLEKPVEGIKFVQEQFPGVVVGADVFLSGEGYILPYYEVLPNGRKWNDRQYLFPIPVEDLVLNPNLEQNPGWGSN